MFWGQSLEGNDVGCRSDGLTGSGSLGSGSIIYIYIYIYIYIR